MFGPMFVMFLIPTIMFSRDLRSPAVAVEFYQRALSDDGQSRTEYVARYLTFKPHASIVETKFNRVA
jgi:hypothetical protein